MLGIRPLFAALLALPVAAHAASRVQAAPVPPEMRSTAFTVTVNGKPVDVAHAAASYDYVSFDITGPVTVEITAAEAGFWDKGVDIQPWRLGIAADPARADDSLPAARAGQALHLAARRLSELRARSSFSLPARRRLRCRRKQAISVYLPGVYHGSLNPKSGETVYLSPGSYFYGSLNLWKVANVKVLGRGTIVYEGPQDPNADEGWMQKPDWHCIGALEARNVEIDGLTCIVRVADLVDPDEGFFRISVSTTCG